MVSYVKLITVLAKYAFLVSICCVLLQCLYIVRSTKCIRITYCRPNKKAIDSFLVSGNKLVYILLTKRLNKIGPFFKKVSKYTVGTRF